MNIAVYPFDEAFCGDELFNENSVYNRDHCLTPYVLLKKKLNEAGHEIHTFDLGDIRQYDKLVLFNYRESTAKIIGSFFKREDRLLFLFEPPVIMPEMWSLKAFNEFSAYFGKIYTYADNLVDDKAFFKFNYPQYMPSPEALLKSFNHPRRHLLAMIGSNHYSDYPGELYTFRREAAGFFTSRIHQFQLYGNSWDFSSYRGRCTQKIEALQECTFSLCLENYAMPGYISEKIFDSFFAGCIPIYLGAPNIASRIPEDTFVDIRSFNSMEMLAEYISQLEQEEIAQYKSNIWKHINSADFYGFSTCCFIDILLDGLQN